MKWCVELFWFTFCFDCDFLYFNNLFCALAKVNASTLKVANFFCYCVAGSFYIPGNH